MEKKEKIMDWIDEMLWDIYILNKIEDSEKLLALYAKGYTFNSGMFHIEPWYRGEVVVVEGWNNV